MTFISVEFAGITTDRLKNSLTPELSEKGLRMNYVRFTSKNQMMAASELREYYAHKPYLCSSQQTS
jgi:hypothetical protein